MVEIGGSRMKPWAILLLLISTCVQAQTPNVRPEETDVYLEVDIRLKGQPNSSSAFPTVRLFQGVRFSPILARDFRFNAPCWRTTGACPQVVGVTLQVFLNIGGNRTNITRLLPMCGFMSECVLPPFHAIQAQPGQAYSFHYSRVKADWLEPPVVVSIQ